MKKGSSIGYRSLHRESAWSLAKYRFASENERYSFATEVPKRNRVQAVFYAYRGSPPSAPQGADRTRESHDLLTYTYCPPCRYQAGKFCLSQSAYSSIPSSLSLSLFFLLVISLVFSLLDRSRFFRSLLPRLRTSRPRRPRISSARSILIYLITYTCTNDVRNGVGMVTVDSYAEKVQLTR